MKTIKEYLKSSGHCPFCNSEQTEGSSCDIEGDAVFQEVSCLDCDKEWFDVYKLVGFQVRERA